MVGVDVIYWTLYPEVRNQSQNLMSFDLKSLEIKKNVPFFVFPHFSQATDVPYFHVSIFKIGFYICEEK